MERMCLLEPLFVDVTWGAGGATADLSLELAANAIGFFNCEAMLHLSCTNMSQGKIKGS
jgi:methylenetetrahydrofolate reductase (NADPH)